MAEPCGGQIEMEARVERNTLSGAQLIWESISDILILARHVYKELFFLYAFWFFLFFFVRQNYLTQRYR